MTAKTCLQTQANGKTCGRTAKARTIAGPVCGLHAKAEERRGGEVTPLLQRHSEPGNIRHRVTVATYDDHIAAAEYEGPDNIAYRRFPLAEWAEANTWAEHVLKPLGHRLNDDKPRDNSGYLYVTAHGMDWRVTECCEAPTTYTGDGAHVCKACYRSVDEAYGDQPVLGDAQPNPQGPVLVTMPKVVAYIGALGNTDTITKVVWKNEDFINGEAVGPMVIAREGQAYALGQQPWVARSKAVAEAQRLGVEFVEA